MRKWKRGLREVLVVNGTKLEKCVVCWYAYIEEEEGVERGIGFCWC